MPKFFPAIFAALCLAGCDGDERTITWGEPDTQLSMMMNLRPMVSLQADWRRTLVVVTAKGRAELKLTDGTGWWRGSNLYEGEPGTWILDEGQPGCILIVADPLSVKELSCPARAVDGDGASVRYKEYRYIGQFFEGGRGEGPPRFLGAAELAEKILPEPI